MPNWSPIYGTDTTDEEWSDPNFNFDPFRPVDVSIPPQPPPVPGPEAGPGPGTETTPPGGEEEGEWTWPGYQGPRSPNYGRLPIVPKFLAPKFDWTSMDLYKDPGYQFRADEGRNQLERSAAAKGVLRSGGTLKDILSWGQGLASQEFQNAFNRAKDAYQFRYQGAQDEYSPLFSEWQARFNAEKSRADKEWQTFWDDYVLGEQTKLGYYQATGE